MEKLSPYCKDTGISKTHAQRIIKYWSDISDVEPSSLRGKPQALSDRGIRHLVRLSDPHPRVTLAEITNEAGIQNLKPRTVGKYICHANRHGFIARRKPWLRMGNRNIRRRWCRERQKWDSEDIRKHVCTDKIKLQVLGGNKCDDNQAPSLPTKLKTCIQHLLENCSV
jgi:hypothetical protein